MHVCLFESTCVFQCACVCARARVWCDRAQFGTSMHLHLGLTFDPKSKAFNKSFCELFREIVFGDSCSYNHQVMCIVGRCLVNYAVPHSGRPAGDITI